MRTPAYSVCVVVLVAFALAGLIPPRAAVATPTPNSAVIYERVFNDCPWSVVTTGNSYPASLYIQDEILECPGFANLHVWHFSVDGVNSAVFENGSAFRYSFDLVISGTAEGEAGALIAPWWSPYVDGRFNVRTTDGEIACFGGRLPFYSFTVSHGINYVKGTTIHLQVTYLPHSLSMADPATIEYELDYNGGHYTSGPLPFDEGNPSEDPPYGLWGILNDARVGGEFQVFLQAGNPNASVRADFTGIVFQNLDQMVPVESTTWGKVKSLYRD